MKPLTIGVALLLVTRVFAGPAAPPQSVLMPVPAQAQWGEGRLAITAALTSSVRDHEDGRVRDSLARMLQLWEERTGLTFARTSTAAFAPPAGEAQPLLVIECAEAANPLPALGDDESYSLSVTTKQAILRAPTSLGVLRGIATLTQLLQSNGAVWFLPEVQIQDAPRYAWRGLLIDVGRHWLPLDVIKRNLDGMALVKLNVLHLHLTEDQGFRIESKKFPRLHELGSDGNYFTQEQAREIVAYAAARGIRVVPEFDVPGHTTSWLVGYPELASAPGEYTLIRRWGVQDPVLDPTNEKLYPVLDAFFGEMATLFPDTYVHIGGDENNGKHWSANLQIQAFIQSRELKDNEGLQAYFNRRLEGIVSSHGKRMIGWDEILHSDIPAQTVVQSWRGAGALAEIARKGFPGILSHGYYLDHLLPAARHYAVDPLPEDSTLSPQEQRRVLGGEACMWGEWVTSETVDSRIWPRAAAIAERLWSPREVKDTADMYRRLASIDQRLEETGLRHRTDREVLLRRFVGERITPAHLEDVRALTNLFEAGDLRVRSKGQPDVTIFTPLTGFADCAQADSPSARAFSDEARTWLFSKPADPEALKHKLTAQLHSWRTLGDALSGGKLAPHSIRVREIAPLGQWLTEVSDIALSVVESPKAENAAELQASLNRLNELRTPQQGVTLPIMAAVRQLVAARLLEPEKRSLSPAEWQVRVEKAASARVDR